MQPLNAIDPAVSGALSRLREALLAPEPEAIALCLTCLREAAARLQSLACELAAHPPDETTRAALGGELRELQRELKRTARLIRSGSDFWAGWARLLGLDTGYTPAGLPAPPGPAGPVRVSEEA